MKTTICASPAHGATASMKRMLLRLTIASLTGVFAGNAPLRQNR
jgi:hypothetical protein